MRAPEPALGPVRVARGARGAVVAPHHLATAAGLGVLADGGSAVDAAIATNAVLAVVMPNGCGIGGDAFWLVWSERDARLEALNGSGAAGSLADPARLRAAGLERLPARGPLTITVPGAVRSWGDAHRRFGRLPPERLLGPAIELAEVGFPAWDGFVGAVEATLAALGDEPWAAGFARVFRPHGRPWREGELVRLPALGATLRRLATDGFDELYEGETARRLARALEAVGAPVTAADLRAHRSTWTEPSGIDYRGVRVTSHPPNSSGVVALELLGLLGRLDPPGPDTFGPHGCSDPAWLHRAIEAAKLALVDRERWLGDPAFVDVPVERLLDPVALAALVARIDPRRADPAPPPVATLVGGTVYLAVVDAAGDVVSLIESNASGFGSGVVDPVTGIHLQNRGASFSLVPGHPNVLAPGKRPAHTLLPGLLLRDGRPWVVVGSMGGDAQPQIHAQVVSALVDGRLDVATAVTAPRWFVRPSGPFGPPVAVAAEPRFGRGVLEALEGLGHPVERVRPFDSLLGHCHAIELVGGGPAVEGGSLAAATDPRSAGLPAVR